MNGQSSASLADFRAFDGVPSKHTFVGDPLLIFVGRY